MKAASFSCLAPGIQVGPNSGSSRTAATAGWRLFVSVVLGLNVPQGLSSIANQRRKGSYQICLLSIGIVTAGHITNIKGSELL